MNYLKKLFNKKEEPINSYEDFWNWFQKNELTFFNVVKKRRNIERLFFKKLSSKLDELKDGFLYLTGMSGDKTVELIFTSDGDVKNFVFIEELVNSSPKLSNWKFIALKPAIEIDNLNIEMSGHAFNKDKLFFYSNEIVNLPDEIDITVVHNDFNIKNESAITNGIYIFLDNYLGELDFSSAIDNITIAGKNEAKKKLIPIWKLKSFIIWRQKEFIEKYENYKYNSENDKHVSLEAELENGNPLIAIINTDLLTWNRKASHPWILIIEIKYQTHGNKGGMPNEETYQLLDEIEDKISEELKETEGYLNIGRQTADSVREIYFACKDYRKPSKTLHKMQFSYSSIIEIVFDIYKDKYWQSFNRFKNIL